MEKRYQVFISSTFVDLEEERKEVMEAIINLNCFPAGMEMFPATDTEQFEYIKSIIDDSDYYVIIVAGKYGSVDESGISYTEKEFDYAKEKGIPILAFVKKDIANIPGTKIESDQAKKAKLQEFRKKICEGRLAKFWDTADELKYKLHSSLSNEFKVHPRTGWVKGSLENNEELLQQINKLMIENQKLHTKLLVVTHDKERSEQDNSGSEIKLLNKKIAVELEINGKEIIKEKLDLYEVFAAISKHIIYETWVGAVQNHLNAYLLKKFGTESRKQINITDDSFVDVKLHLMALQLIELSKGTYEYMQLSALGKTILMKSVSS